MSATVEEIASRTVWFSCNAFTSTFNGLDRTIWLPWLWQAGKLQDTVRTLSAHGSLPQLPRIGTAIEVKGKRLHFSRFGHVD